MFHPSMKRHRPASPEAPEMRRTSPESTVLSRDGKSKASNPCSGAANEDEASSASESGWTSYLDHHNSSNNNININISNNINTNLVSSSPQPPPPLPPPPPQEQGQGRKRRKRSLARQDSTLSVLSDASSGPAKDHSPRDRFSSSISSQEQIGDNILRIEKSPPCDEDNGSDIDNATFETIERRLQVLQRLIPDGNKFRDEEMLDKAIEYVHFLQRKIQIFESKRREPNRGAVCLIPLKLA